MRLEYKHGVFSAHNIVLNILETLFWEMTTFNLTNYITN